MFHLDNFVYFVIFLCQVWVPYIATLLPGRSMKMACDLGSTMPVSVLIPWYSTPVDQTHPKITIRFILIIIFIKTNEITCCFILLCFCLCFYEDLFFWQKMKSNYIYLSSLGYIPNNTATFPFFQWRWSLYDVILLIDPARWCLKIPQNSGRSVPLSWTVGFCEYTIICKSLFYCKPLIVSKIIPVGCMD